MAKNKSYSPIVIAEDDEDDYQLIVEALKEAGNSSQIEWVKDGEELLEYLSEIESNSKDPDSKISKPHLIILDLNMPKKDGREALQEIKASEILRRIPVVVLTTSKSESDIQHTYDLGVNSFIQKPVRYSEFVDMAKVLSQYWFHTVKLPS